MTFPNPPLTPDPAIPGPDDELDVSLEASKDAPLSTAEEVENEEFLGLTDGDLHDRGRACNNAECPECYVPTPTARELVPDVDAYVSSLEDALERREVGARLLDRILATTASGEVAWELKAEPPTLRVDTETIELTAAEARFIAARERAGFAPDTGE